MSEDNKDKREKLFLCSFTLCQEVSQVHQRQGAVEVQCFTKVNKIASAYVMGLPITTAINGQLDKTSHLPIPPRITSSV
jgi:hypothetical protein